MTLLKNQKIHLCGGIANYKGGKMPFHDISNKANKRRWSDQSKIDYWVTTHDVKENRSIINLGRDRDFERSESMHRSIFTKSKTKKPRRK